MESADGGSDERCEVKSASVVISVSVDMVVVWCWVGCRSGGRWVGGGGTEGVFGRD